MRNIFLKFFVALVLSAPSTAIYGQNQTLPSQTKVEASVIYEKAISSVVFITVIDGKGGLFTGSGVIMRPDGIIATNYHVIDGAISARILLRNGDSYDDIAVVDSDEKKDIAILKIKAMNLPAIALADSDTLKIGSNVYAIGAPRGLTGTLSSGIVSSLRPISEVDSSMSGFRIIQFTAPISPGSSGGALLDDYGRLIGLTFASRTESQNLNLAIPVNYVAPLASEAKTEGRALKRFDESQIAKTPSPESPQNIRTASKEKTIDDIAGTYSGSWQSDSYSVSGGLLMKVTVVDGKVEATVALTGSEYVKGDTLAAFVTPVGDGAWRMDYKGKNTKVAGSGLFKDGQFVGDYKLRKLLWIDKGRWNLRK